MEIINKLDEKDIGASLLRLNRDLDKIKYYVSKINEMKEDLDAKLEYMKNIQKQLNVYKYIVINLLNLAQKWCVDNGSPVYFFVMNNARDTCSHCNAGQGSETNCGENYYNEAFDTMNHVDYGFCDGCQSIYTTGDAPDECISCESCDSCQHCNSCEGCDSCQSCNSGCQGGYGSCIPSFSVACTSGNISTYCNTCFGGCQGCDSGCHGGYSCNVCVSAQSCGSSYSSGGTTCRFGYGF